MHNRSPSISQIGLTAVTNSGGLGDMDDSTIQLDNQIVQDSSMNVDDLTRSFAVEKRFNTQGATPKEYLKSVSFQIQLSCKLC